MSDPTPNDTIIKMVNLLHPPTMDSDDSQQDEFNYTALKRRLSENSKESSSLDEASPAKKVKMDNKLDMSYIGSPREMRRLRADLVESRNTILNLENRVQQMHSIRKEMQIMFDNETRSVKQQNNHYKKQVAELEGQLQSIRKRESVLRSELSQVKNNYDNLKLKTDKQLEEMEKSMSDSLMEKKVADTAERGEIGKLQRKLMEMENLLQAARDDAESHKRLAEELGKELTEKNSISKDLEIKTKDLQKMMVQLKEYDYVKENYLEYQEQSKTQSYKLLRYVEMEKENTELRDENNRIKNEIQNKLLMEEEIYDLKKRLYKYKEVESKYSSLQVQQTQIEMCLDEWKAVARGVCETVGSDASLPHLLRSAVERLQQQEILLTDEKVTLQSELNQALHDAKSAKDELAKNLKLLAKMNTNYEQKCALMHRMQKKLSLVSRERDSYRLQLDSYERDLTMSGANVSAMGTQAANQLQTQKERIENLEQIVGGYRDMLAKMENDQLGQSTDNSEIAPVKLEQLARLKDELARLKLENKRLIERKDELEIQMEDLLVGQDSLRGGQVVHLVNNPLSDCVNQRENMIEKLEQEVDRLKRKVKNMEEGLESSKLADMSMSTKEISALKELIASHESQKTQLTDYFKSSIQEFRDVVYMLFGYKVDKTKGIYMLTNIYAENEGDILLFQLNRDGGLNLLENDYSATLGNMIDLHLQHQNSIPVFLSTLTVDLFTSKTLTSVLK